MLGTAHDHGDQNPGRTDAEQADRADRADGPDDVSRAPRDPRNPRNTGSAVETTRVDELFREVDDRFSDLERQYAQARSDLRPVDPSEEMVGTGDPAAASAARFELVSQVAALTAEVELRNNELDERDALLAEFSDRMMVFEQRLRSGESAERSLVTMRSELHEERREVARLGALLDARATERHELAEITQRLQNEKNHLDTLLSTAIERFDEAEQVRTDLGEKLTRLESAREAEAAEHQERYHELSEARAEMRRLTELVDELTLARDEANRRADKSESRFERRANEVNYLQRRIDSLTGQLNDVDATNEETTRLHKENLLLARQLQDAEAQLAAKTNEVAEARIASDRGAVLAAEHDQLVARINELEAESGAVGRAEREAPAERSEISDLVARARDLGVRRGQVAAPAAAQIIETPVIETPIIETPSAEASGAIEDLSDAADPVEVDDEHGVEGAVDEANSSRNSPFSDAAEVNDAVAAPEPAPDPGDGPDTDVSIEFDAPFLDLSADLSAGVPNESNDHEVAAWAALDEPGEIGELGETGEADSTDDVPLFELGSARRRLVLPANVKPDTPAAFQFLVDRPGVVAVVDARSFCKRTGARPSELFHRLEALRDRYDLPIEVVLTPVSTPVGGAPDLSAVGVHHVTGSDTVADRVRALCLGFPKDQPIIVIAGDDHVRRASIAEEANVVDPAVVFDVT